MEPQQQSSDFKMEFKPTEKSNPFLERSSRANFIPQTNSQVRTSSMEQHAANESFDVNAGKETRRSVERHKEEDLDADSQA